MNCQHIFLKTSLLAVSAYSICFGMKPEQTQPLVQLDVATIQNALNRGLPIDMQNQKGWTYLHIAAYLGKQEVVRFLLSKNANSNSKSKDNGCTPLHAASNNGRAQVVELLLQHGADKEARTQSESTPLHLASLNGHAQVVELLLQYGANKEAQDRHLNTSLHLASINGHAKVVELLLQHGADKETQDQNRNAPLHAAADRGHVEVVKLLLRHGADKEARNKDGYTPLHIATYRGNTEIIKILLSHNAAINSSFQYNNHNWTPLLMALNNNHNKVAGLLLDYGAQIPHGNQDRLNQVQNNKYELRKALHSQDSFRKVKDLLKQGAYADAAVQHLLNVKYKALLNAVDHGNIEAVKKLSQEGLSLALCDSNGNSLSHRAVLKEHIPMIEYLLSIGADPGVYNKQGLTPVALAAQKEHLLNVFFKYCKDNTWQNEATHDDKRLKKG